jgi:hypothetical protein
MKDIGRTQPLNNTLLKKYFIACFFGFRMLYLNQIGEAYNGRRRNYIMLDDIPPDNYRK